MRPKSEIYTSKRDDEHPHHFHMRSPPPGNYINIGYYFHQKDLKGMAPVVQKVDNAIHRINHYPLNSAIGFPNTYPWDSDLSVG